jgi:thymidylate synthase (FAD)
MPNKISVLDKGYITHLDTLGSDVSVINSARVSFDKSITSLSRLDFNLLDYLVKNRHDSVLRHCVMSFEVYAPLFVARQWWKHHVGATSVDGQNGWNESSRRYITEEPEFYLPSEWRSAPDNKKQGSDEPVDPIISAKYSRLLEYFNETSMHAYNSAMEDGICTEQARLFLPAYAMYVRWRWTASLNALLHFIDLRKDHHAQWEMQQYALVIEGFVKQSFPATYTSWEKFRG